MGYSLGIFRAFEGRGKLGLSRLRVTLQGLDFLAELLELLLYLRHPRLLLLSPGAFRGRIAFGRGHRLLQGRHLVHGPYSTHVILVILIAT